MKIDQHVWVRLGVHIENERNDGRVRASYAGLIDNGMRSVSFGGVCYVRATETPFAFGIKHAIRLSRELYGCEQPLRCWVRNAAVYTYVNDHAPKWEGRLERNSRHKYPEGRREWIDAYKHKMNFGLEIMTTNGHQMKEAFAQIEEMQQTLLEMEKSGLIRPREELTWSRVPQSESCAAPSQAAFAA